MSSLAISTSFATDPWSSSFPRSMISSCLLTFSITSSPSRFCCCWRTYIDSLWSVYSPSLLGQMLLYGITSAGDGSCPAPSGSLRISDGLVEETKFFGGALICLQHWHRTNRLTANKTSGLAILTAADIGPCKCVTVPPMNMTDTGNQDANANRTKKGPHRHTKTNMMRPKYKANIRRFPSGGSSPRFRISYATYATYTLGIPKNNGTATSQKNKELLVSTSTGKHARPPI
mmetsp:Transcript_18374/g.34182  ORF Transcript_18374/g.34182 Transcript_18374/m.34182 type:complete len:231 (-) Transcript_18374:181-873(-)